MTQHGWNWASKDAADTYTLIVVETGCYDGSLGGREALAALAEEVVRLEGRIPDSFEVAVDLGCIYSAAAVRAASDVQASNRFIAMANNAWRVASSQLNKGSPNDATLSESGAGRAAYLSAYWQIQSEIRLAKYLQAGCTDATDLRTLKKDCELARRTRPDDPVPQAIADEIDAKLSRLELTEGLRDRSPPFVPGSDLPKIAGDEEGPRRLRIAVLVIVMAVSLAGLTYVYRPPEHVWQLLHGTLADLLRGKSGRQLYVPPETAAAAPANQLPADEHRLTEASKAMPNAEGSAEELKALPKPVTPNEPSETLSHDMTEPQQAPAPDHTEKTAAPPFAPPGKSAERGRSRNVEKATRLEHQALQALVAGDFKEGQRFFQASENAANGIHYSYEWANLLHARRAELQTPEGQRAVLRFALSKGYASYAPSNIRDKLRHLAR